MILFPAYAKILKRGYSDIPSFNVARTDMDDGMAKQVPRRSIPIVTRNVTILVETFEDRIAFDLWVKTDLHGGAGWFSWVDPVDKQTKQARIVGGRLEWSTPGGTVWEANAQIETLG